jgi:6-phosphofructokinase 1
MNAAIRAVVRASLHKNLGVVGCFGGYQGILDGDFVTLERKSVANIIQRGGTILKSKRCLEFHKPEARQKAVQNLRSANIDALICIGGDGSFRGAQALFREFQYPVVCVPGTIDNDIYGTEQTIGFDTAVNTALEAIDRIRDTASSHNRLFIVEVMGRDSGFIATTVGVAGGAEEIFIPEQPITVEQAVATIQNGIQRGKTSSILVTAEGKKPGRAYDLAEGIRKRSGFEAKVCILGHIQRGGSPTANDRLLASRLGTQAVEVLSQGQCNVMLGIGAGQLVLVDLDSSLGKNKSPEKELLNLTPILSR